MDNVSPYGGIYRINRKKSGYWPQYWDEMSWENYMTPGWTRHSNAPLWVYFGTYEEALSWFDRKGITDVAFRSRNHLRGKAI